MFGKDFLWILKLIVLVARALLQAEPPRNGELDNEKE